MLRRGGTVDDNWRGTEGSVNVHLLCDWALAAAAERGGATVVPAAVVGYVTRAVEYVEELELPLPTDGFAERIEELAGVG